MSQVANRQHDSSRVLDRGSLAADIRELSKCKLNLALAAFAWNWLWIGAAITLAVVSANPLVYVVAAVVVATRQHALGILVHEAAHYRITSHRGWNDFLSDILAAFPLGIATSGYRRSHHQHHQNTNTCDDPDVAMVHDDNDWVWPKSRIQACGVFLRDLLGLNLPCIAKFFWSWSPWSQWRKLTNRERTRLGVFLFLALSSIALADAWFYVAVLWWLPQITVLTAIFRLRGIAEHCCCDHSHELNEWRTVIPTWWERVLVCPHNVNYHLEHHLFPSVPFYNLPELHRRLAARDDFARKAHITHGYFSGLMSEVFASLQAEPSC